MLRPSASLVGLGGVWEVGESGVQLISSQCSEFTLYSIFEPTEGGGDEGVEAKANDLISASCLMAA